MAYAEHLLVTWSGTLGPNEIWSTGCRYIPNAAVGQPVPSSDDLDNTVSDHQAAVAAQFANAGSGIPGGVKLQFFKMNWILPNGRYRDPVTHLHEYNPQVNGAAAAQTPDFTTTAISHRSGLTRGPAHAGRQYWPNFGLALTSIVPSLVDASARNGALAWHHNMLRVAVGGVDPMDTWSYLPVIASRKYGVNRRITEFAMGNVLDVQRRRKESEPETYVTLPA